MRWHGLRRPVFLRGSGRASRICIVARFPRPGKVKTRLGPALSDGEVLQMHERLVRQAVRSARALAATGEASVELRTDAASPRLAHAWLGVTDIAYRYQGDGDLGERIQLSFAEAFGEGAERVVVIGSDCPRLSGAHLRDALRRLNAADVVLGPASDGGYYLIALRRASANRSVPVLFSGVAWSTETVLVRTQQLAQAAALTWSLLETLPDVDGPDDLVDGRRALARSVVAADARVSVVIPALNDAELLPNAVASAYASGAAEVLVVDGGSRDATREVAEAAGARLLKSAPGRARQMNAGAAVASGEVLLFLHADTELPGNACALARAALAWSGVVAGAFSFAVPAAARYAAIISMVGRARSRIGGAPWGDQCLFLSRDTFRELGGFPEQPVLEDMEFSRRLKRFGDVVTLNARATTSARAWAEHGLVFSTAVNIAVTAAYLIGVDSEHLARWRRRIAPGARSNRPPK